VFVFGVVDSLVLMCCLGWIVCVICRLCGVLGGLIDYLSGFVCCCGGYCDYEVDC